MLKTTITRFFLGGVLAVIAGTILAIGSIWIAIANDVFVTNGSDIVGLNGSPLAWSVLTLAAAGSLAVIAGLIAGFASWIGALLNTSQLDRKTWFISLLLLGIFNLGFVAMIGYLLAGPDATTSSRMGSRPAIEATSA